MITKIHYKNFKALRDATLLLGRFTLIVGANGTGKSTAINAIKDASNPFPQRLSDILSADLIIEDNRVEVAFEWDNPNVLVKSLWWRQQNEMPRVERFQYSNPDGNPQPPEEFLAFGIPTKTEDFINSFKTFSFAANVIAYQVPLTPDANLMEDVGYISKKPRRAQNFELYKMML